MGKEGIALKDRIDVPAVRWQTRHIDAANHHATGSRLLEARNEAQRRRLSASARAQEREEDAPLHLKC